MLTAKLDRTGHDAGPTRPDRRWPRSMAAWAGFLGAVPAGFCLSVPVLVAVQATRVRHVGVIDFLSLFCFTLFSSTLPLIPFAIALAWVGRRGRPRILATVVPGLAVGGASLFLFWFAGVVLFPAGAIGLIFGLVAVLPCWWRGDAAGQALAVLGTTPAIVLLVLMGADGYLRGVRLDGPSPLVPFLTNRDVLLGVVLAFFLTYALVISRWIGRGLRRRAATTKPNPSGPGIDPEF